MAREPVTDRCAPPPSPCAFAPSRTSRRRPLHPRPRRGISLILVTAVVATATVMAMAVLSTNALQASAAAGQATVLQADALAESALNRAIYYAQNLDSAARCPAQVAAGLNYSESNVSLGSAVPGTFNLAMKSSGTYRWDVTATGVATSTRGSVIRQITATVEANFFGHALSFGSSGTPTIPASVTVAGDVYAPAAVTNAGTISGTLYAPSATNSGLIGFLRSSLGLSATPVPPLLAANHYALTYTFNSAARIPSLLPAASLTNVTLNPTAANPAGVYYWTGDVTLNGNVKINGTLVVNAGKLKVKGTGNSITSQTGTPAVAALVVDSDIQYIADNSNLTVNGLAWMGTKVSRLGATGAGCQLTVNGALLCASGNAFDAAIPTTITYNRTKASVPNFTTNVTRQAPSTVTVLSWTN